MLRRNATVALVVMMLTQPALARVDASPAYPPSPPLQQATGPGGAETVYAGMRGGHYGSDPASNSEPTGFWLYEPAVDAGGVSVAAGPLPLVILFHGYHGGTAPTDAADPTDFASWIDHLVRRGVIVVFPDWEPANAQQLAFDRALPDAIMAIQAAVTELGTSGHTAPDLGHVAVVGHSYGAILAAAYAATSARGGAPAPTAVLLAMPGCLGLAPAACKSLGDLSAIPATTRIVVVTGTDEHIFPLDPAWVWGQLGSVPADHKDYVTMASDDHGQPALVADHFVAVTDNWAELDALDWYGTWKWLDALMSCSFAGKDCRYALGDTPEQRFMGTWGDGVPVTEARVTQHPATPTA
jgi:acetyl esterase/lipase